MKKLLVSDDKTVVKIIHDDNSETAIKTISSCDTYLTEDGEFEVNENDRNKYSIFISDSAGCYMKCQFCYLTLKEMKFKKLNGLAIFDNLIEAIEERIEYNILHYPKPGTELPEIHEKFVKLCWMGMGDAFVDTHKLSAVTQSTLNYIMDRGYAIGLDGVDLSTVIPRVKNINETFEHLRYLDDVLADYPFNPHSDILVHRDTEFSNTETVYPNRSRFRLFYSVHSAIQSTRDELIPHAMPLDKAIPALVKYSENNKYNVIFHHMFMDGFNDSDEEIDALIAMIEKYELQNYELRILRYNTCEVSTYIHESDRFKEIIKRIMEVHPFVKVQISAGSEVKAACGQFLAMTD